MTASRPPTGPQSTLSTAPGGRPPRQGFRIAGFSLRLTPGGYLLAGLIGFVAWLSLAEATPGRSATAYLLGTLGVVVMVIASFFAHEMAHGVVARRHGKRVEEIRLGLGAGAGHGEDAETPRAAWRVALAGPLVNLVIAGVAIGIAVLPDGLPSAVFVGVAYVNLLIAVLTLLPGAGLDGGRIVRAVLWARSGDKDRAGIGAGRVGTALGVLAMGAGFVLLLFGMITGLWVALFGLALMIGGRAQVRQGMMAGALKGLRVDDVMPERAAPIGTAADWRTVAAFLSERPAGDQTTAWPLCDFEGKLSGLLTMTQLGAVRPAQRDSARLRQVGVPLAQTVTTTAGEALTDLLPRLSRPAGTPQGIQAAGHAVVVDADGAPTAVLTPADIARAVQLGAMRHRSTAA